MRNFLLCMIAVGVAIFLSSFNYMKDSRNRKLIEDKNKKIWCVYFIYNLNTWAGEKIFSNYTLDEQIPWSGMCPSQGIVCWIRVCDIDNDGGIGAVDFNLAVNGLDIDKDGRISDDWAIENPTAYQEKQ